MADNYVEETFTGPEPAPSGRRSRAPTAIAGMLTTAAYAARPACFGSAASATGSRDTEAPTPELWGNRAPRLARS